MKKISILLLCAFLLAGCAGALSDESTSVSPQSETSSGASSASRPEFESPEPDPIEESSAVAESVDLDVTAQFIPCGETMGTTICAVCSVEEKETVIGFAENDERDHYDEAFFENRTLLVAKFYSSSGSKEYGLRKVTRHADGSLEVWIDRIDGREIGTCDVAYWLALIELPEGVTVADDTPLAVHVVE